MGRGACVRALPRLRPGCAAAVCVEAGSSAWCAPDAAAPARGRTSVKYVLHVPHVPPVPQAKDFHRNLGELADALVVQHAYHMSAEEVLHAYR